MPRQVDFPLVTIYVVNRNYGRFLRQAIESVLSQDYPALEILVVDDASEDCTADVLDDFERDLRIRVIRQTVNRGLTVSCNVAIQSSRGELVMRLDADDFLQPFAVSTLVRALVADPQAVLVFPDYVEVDARGVVIRRVQRHDFNALDSMSDLPAHGACTLVRRSFIDSFGGYDETINCQDGVDLWLNVGEGQRVLHVSVPLFCYRQHGHNLTRGERSLLQARAQLIAKHVLKRRLPRPRVLGLVPVRGQVVDPGSGVLNILGDRPLLDWTFDEALSCGGIDRVIVSSPDEAVLDHVANRYGSLVGIHRREMELARWNVSLRDTLSSVLAAESAQGREYDALLTLTVESPFRSSLFVQQAIDVMQLFGTDAVVGVRREDEIFYRHDGLGLQAMRQDDQLRLERDDLFRDCGGMRLARIPLTQDASEHMPVSSPKPTRVGHVLLDQLAAFAIRTPLDWTVAQHLSEQVVRERISG